MRDRGGQPTSPDRNLFSYLADLVKPAHERIDNVQRQLKIPTLPIYDSTNFPDNAIHGQIVGDYNDPDTAWMYGLDDEWHEIGGGSKWAIASIDKSAFTLANNLTAVAPFDDTDDTRWLTNAPNLFTLDTVNHKIVTHGGGAYIVIASMFPEDAGSGIPRDVTKYIVCYASDDGGDVTFSSAVIGAGFDGLSGNIFDRRPPAAPPPYSLNFCIVGNIDRGFFAKIENRMGVTMGIGITALLIIRISGGMSAMIP